MLSGQCDTRTFDGSVMLSDDDMEMQRSHPHTTAASKCRLSSASSAKGSSYCLRKSVSLLTMLFSFLLTMLFVSPIMKKQKHLKDCCCYMNCKAMYVHNLSIRNTAAWCCQVLPEGDTNATNYEATEACFKRLQLCT